MYGKSEIAGFEPYSGFQVSKKQNIPSPLYRNDSILWGTSVTRGSVPDLRPPGFELRILCLDCGVISSHPQEVLLAHFRLYVHKGGLRPHSFRFSSLKLYNDEKCVYFGRKLLSYLTTVFLVYIFVVHTKIHNNVLCLFLFISYYIKYYISCKSFIN